MNELSSDTCNSREPRAYYSPELYLSSCAFNAHSNLRGFMKTVHRSVVASTAACAPQPLAVGIQPVPPAARQATTGNHIRRRQLLRKQRLAASKGFKAALTAPNRSDLGCLAIKDGAVEAQAVSTSAFAALILFALAWSAEPAAAAQHVHQSDVFQLATGDSDFWVNVSRYGRYFITVLLGTAYISVKPILQLLKRPKTAVAVIVGLVALYLFVSTTVQAMLGVSNPLEYQPSGFFPDNY